MSLQCNELLRALTANTRHTCPPYLQTFQMSNYNGNHSDWLHDTASCLSKNEHSMVFIECLKFQQSSACCICSLSLAILEYYQRSYFFCFMQTSNTSSSSRAAAVDISNGSNAIKEIMKINYIRIDNQT